MWGVERVNEWSEQTLIFLLLQAQLGFAVLDCPQFCTVAARGQERLRQLHSGPLGPRITGWTREAEGRRKTSECLKKASSFSLVDPMEGNV